MRTRKNKKYLKKYRNKTKKYGGVATAPAQTTRYGRQSKKPDTFAKEQGDQLESETKRRQSKPKSKTTAKSKTKARTTKLDSTIVKPSININKFKLIKFLKAKTEIKKDIQNAYNIKSSNPGKYGDFSKVDFQKHFEHITDINELNELIKNFDNIAKKHIDIQSYGTDAELRKWFKSFKNDVIPNYTTIEKIDKLLILLNMSGEINLAREERIKKIIQELDIPNNKVNLGLFLQNQAVKNNPNIVQKLQTIVM
jgi:hypothetical protein